MKFSSKSEFASATEEQWQLLWDQVEIAWQSPKNHRPLKQILSHLYGWHRLLEDWFRIGKTGTPDLPATGFKWNQTVALNKKLDDQHKDLGLASVRRRLKLSHGRIMKLVESLSEQQFNSPGQFAWTNKNALSSYIVPNTFSHYRWAIKKIKRTGDS